MRLASLMNNDNKSGVILITVLWVTLILSISAVSLGKGANMELSLAKYAIKNLKAKYIAMAGLSFSLDQIVQDTKDEETDKFDSLYYCGISKKNLSSLEDKFEKMDVGEGYFKVGHIQRDVDGVAHSFYGFQDEERKININSLNVQNINIFISLIQLNGFDEQIAKEIGYAAVDWIDNDNSLSDQQYGAEDDHYMTLTKPYHCKNLAFDSIEEILLVKGMTEEIYDKIRGNLTLYPKGGIFKVNFDTAPEIVLRAIIQAMITGSPAFDINDADALVEKVLEFRKGEDGIILTADDRIIDANAIPLNANEKILFLMVNQFRTKKSDHLLINVEGFEQEGKIRSTIAAVVDRNDLKILSFKVK